MLVSLSNELPTLIRNQGHAEIKNLCCIFNISTTKRFFCLVQLFIDETNSKATDKLDPIVDADIFFEVCTK